MKTRWPLIAAFLTLVTIPALVALFGLRPTSGTSVTGASEIAYAREGQLYALAVATNEERRISRFPAGTGAKDPTWSPDGTRIVFSLIQPAQRGAPAGMDLYSVDRDGNDQTLVVKHKLPGEQLQSPAYRPGDGSLYFSRFVPAQAGETGDRLEIVRLNSVTNQTEVVAQDGVMPSFSSDGRMLAYVHLDPDTSAPSLWVMDLASGKATPVIPVDSFATIFWPSFSPDGAEIAFGGAPVQLLRSPGARPPGLALRIPVARPQSYPHGEPSDLYVVNRTSGKVEKVGTLAEDDPTALWSADGSHLWAIGSRGIYSVDRDGRNFSAIRQQGGYGGSARPVS